MANRERGEVAVKTLDGKEYTCATSHNALCALMTAWDGKKPEEVVSLALEDDPFALRAVMWCFLQKFHRDEITSYEIAGDWLDSIGGRFAAMKLIMDLGKANLEMHGIKVPEGNPPEAQSGTGESSSSELAKPV